MRSAVGVPDLAVAIDDVATWKAVAECANAYRCGRVFLAGDAAHVVPPTGGFGGNTGVQDAANLAWKLAAVLRGEAGETLLDSYEAERLPVGRLTVEQAWTRYVRRVVPEEVDAATPEQRDELTMELGQFYGSSAVIGGRGEGEPACVHSDATRGRPGSRVPHAWLADGRSSIDCARRGFALLAGPAGSGWIEAATGEGLDSAVLPAAALDRFGFGEAGALLARPDGFVAWRSGDGEVPSARGLRQVLAGLRGA